MKRSLRAVALVGALCLVPIACGGDDDEESTTATTESTSDEAASDEDGQPSDTLGSRGDDDEGDEGDVEAWCAKYDELEGVDLNLEELGAPAEVESDLNAIVDGVRELEDLSPAEVRSDVGRLGGFIEQLRDAAEENDYDVAPLATDAELRDAFTDGELEAAGGNVDSYYESNCAASTTATT